MEELTLSEAIEMVQDYTQCSREHAVLDVLCGIAVGALRLIGWEDAPQAEENRN